MPRPTREESMQRWRTARDHSQDSLNALRKLRDDIEAAIRVAENQAVSAFGKTEEGLHAEESAEGSS